MEPCGCGRRWITRRVWNVFWVSEEGCKAKKFRLTFALTPLFQHNGMIGPFSKQWRWKRDLWSWIKRASNSIVLSNNFPCPLSFPKMFQVSTSPPQKKFNLGDLSLIFKSQHDLCTCRHYGPTYLHQCMHGLELMLFLSSRESGILGLILIVDLVEVSVSQLHSVHVQLVVG